MLKVDGEVLVECTPILRYIGKLTGMYPRDYQQALYVDCIMATMADMNPIFGGLAEDAATKNKRFHQEAGRYMQPLCNWVEAMNDGPYFLGSMRTVADLHVYSIFRMAFVLGMLPGLSMEDLKPWPAMLKWLTYMEKQDAGVQAYFRSRKGETVPPQCTNGAEFPLNYAPRKIDLSYFDIELGRAGAIRAALHSAGIPFNDIRLDGATFGKMKASGELPLGSLPIIRLDDGPVLCQSIPIQRYAAKLAKLYPTHPHAAAKVDLAMSVAQDGLGNLVKAGAGADDQAAARQAYLLKDGKKYFGYLEEMLKNNGGNYLVGENMTIADLSFWNMGTFCFGGYAKGVTLADLDKHFPLLGAMVKRVEADERIQNWRHRNAVDQEVTVQIGPDVSNSEVVKLNLSSHSSVKDLMEAIAAAKTTTADAIKLVCDGKQLKDEGELICNAIQGTVIAIVSKSTGVRAG